MFGCGWWCNAKAHCTLVIGKDAIFGVFRKDHPALGCRPGPGGWRRIVAPLATLGCSVA